MKKIGDEYEKKVGDVKKIIPNLGNKTDYVVHYRNPQLYLSLAMKLSKIHRALKFNQYDGKTMENLRKRMNVRLVNNEKDFKIY